jgi:radical SAM superfamily enzyme YgiQ (UPF0313 family)
VTSLRGYEVADRFRERGVPVLMGGPHATFHADEMAAHADAVCVGEAEDVFPEILEDAAAGRLRKVYRRDKAGAAPPDARPAVGPPRSVEVRLLPSVPIPFKQSHWAAWNLHFLQSKVASNLDRMRDFTGF